MFKSTIKFLVALLCLLGLPKMAAAAEHEFTQDELTAMQDVLTSNENTVFYYNKWSWSGVYCYWWDDSNNNNEGDYKGEAMTQLTDGSSIYYYSYTGTSTLSGVKFTDGSWSNQTSDYSWTIGGYYEYVYDTSTTSSVTAAITSETTLDELNGTSSGEETGDSGYTDEELEAMKAVLGDHTVFYRNSQNWSTVYCYTWDTGSTTSDAMTLVENTDNIYYYTSTSSHSGEFLFYNGSWQGTNQTDNFTWTDGGYYEYSSGLVATITIDDSGADGSTSSTNTDVVVTTTYTYTVSYDNSDNYSPVYCYIYDSTGAVEDDYIAGNWPGTEMTCSENSSTYTCTITTTAEIGNLMVVFNNSKNKTDEGAAQSSDLTFSEYVTSTTSTTTVTVPVTSAGYATLYYGSALSIPDGVTAYIATATDTEASTLTCTAISDVIPANTGVLLQATEGTYDFTVTTTDAEYTENMFEGTLTELTVGEGDTYYTLGYPGDDTTGTVGFYTFSGTTIGANKAYLTNTTGEAKGFSIVFGDDGGEATGIQAVATTATATDAAIYNLQGQRVSAPTIGGIYIQNGRKFIAK